MLTKKKLLISSLNLREASFLCQLEGYLSCYVKNKIEINRMESTMKITRQNALIFSFTFMAFILGTTESIIVGIL